jgi:hypothetical protein
VPISVLSSALPTGSCNKYLQKPEICIISDDKPSNFFISEGLREYTETFKFGTDTDMAAPPELRVLCRRLASTPVDDLPRLCPLLVSHVLRCAGPLSAPQDGKAKDKSSSDTPVLVHKLRTHITTLLTGKNPAGRFAGVCLVKAVIDVGGWESLRASDAWLRGLIGVLQV